MPELDIFSEVRKIAKNKSHLQAKEALYRKLDNLEELFMASYAAVYHDERGQGIGYDKAMEKLRKTVLALGGKF